MSRLHPFAFCVLCTCCAGAGPKRSTSRGTDVSIPRADEVETAPGSLPRHVDLDLPTPDYAQILGFARDGATLLRIHGRIPLGPKPAETKPDAFVPNTTTTYLAVLDARHACIEETITEPVLASTIDATAAQGLSVVSSSAGRDELGRLRSVSQRFDVRALELAIFGANDAFVLVQSSGRIFLSSGGRPYVSIELGIFNRLVAAPSGHSVAFEHCLDPCQGVYEPALLDARTGKFTDFRIGNVHDFHWTKDGRTLYFTYDDSRGVEVDATKICVARLNVGQSKPSTLKCLSSHVNAESVSHASPSAGLIAVQTLGERPSTQALVGLEMPAAKEVFRLDAEPVGADIDDEGRVVWDDVTRDGQYRVYIHAKGRGQQSPNAKSAGFLRDGSVLTLPAERLTAKQTPLRTLRDQRCGLFAVWRPK